MSDQDISTLSDPSDIPGTGCTPVTGPIKVSQPKFEEEEEQDKPMRTAQVSGSVGTPIDATCKIAIAYSTNGTAGPFTPLLPDASVQPNGTFSYTWPDAVAGGTYVFSAVALGITPSPIVYSSPIKIGGG